MIYGYIGHTCGEDNWWKHEIEEDVAIELDGYVCVVLDAATHDDPYDMSSRYTYS